MAGWKVVRDAPAPSPWLNRGEAFGAGLVSPVVGAGQLAGHGVSALTGWQAPRRYTDQAAGAINRAESRAPLFGLAGTVLSPVNFIGGEELTGSRLLDAALQGGVLGASQPVTPGSGNFLTTKAEQAAAGGTLGAALGGASAALKRVAGGEAAQLAREGLPVTPGQLGGKAGKMLEGLMASGPLPMAFVVQQRQLEALQGWNRRLFGAVEKSFLGPAVRWSGKIGRQGVDELLGRLGSAYDAVLGKGQFALPTVTAKDLPTAALVGAKKSDSVETLLIRHAPTILIGRLGLTDDFDAMTPRQQEDAIEAIRGIVVHNTPRGQGDSVPVDGPVVQLIRRRLHARIQHYTGAGRDQDLGLANFLRNFTGNWMDAVTTGDPETEQTLRHLDVSYAMASRLADASEADKEDGIITPKALLGAISKNSKARGSRAFARGHALLQTEAERANRVLTPAMAPSPWMQRATDIGALYSAMRRPVETAAAVEVPTLAYTRPVAAGIRRAATSAIPTITVRHAAAPLASATGRAIAPTPSLSSALGTPPLGTVIGSPTVPTR